MPPPLWEEPSTKIEIISQTFHTTLGWASGRFKSHALICGAQPIFGEQKMTPGVHLMCSPLRCLKSFQSSPSWSRHGWSLASQKYRSNFVECIQSCAPKQDLQTSPLITWDLKFRIQSKNEWRGSLFLFKISLSTWFQHHQSTTIKGSSSILFLVTIKIMMEQKKTTIWDLALLELFSTYTSRMMSKLNVACRKRILRNMSTYTYICVSKLTTDNNDLWRNRNSGGNF